MLEFGNTYTTVAVRIVYNHAANLSINTTFFLLWLRICLSNNL